MVTTIFHNFTIVNFNSEKGHFFDCEKINEGLGCLKWKISRLNDRS